MSVALNSLVNNYTYNYQGGLRPKLDKDDDGTWSKTEVENYVTEYNKVVSNDKKLDTAKIMEQYDGDGDGKITGAEMSKLIEADALGTSVLQKMQKASSSTSTSASTATSSASSVTSDQRAAVKATFNHYVYTSGKNLRISYTMDSNNDSYWDRSEIDKYAESYKKATGVELDVDALFKNYDKDEDGVLNYKEQQAAQKADAFGLNKLASMFDEITSDTSSYYTKPITARKSEDTTSSSSTGSWLDSLSTSQKTALTALSQRCEQSGYLISAMLGGSYSAANLSTLVNQQSSSLMYSKYSYSGLDSYV